MFAAVEQCPACGGRRLRETREERDHKVGGVLYTGFVQVVVCKTCRVVHKDRAEEEAFVRAVEEVASKVALPGVAPRKIHQRK